MIKQHYISFVAALAPENILCREDGLSRQEEIGGASMLEEGKVLMEHFRGVF